MCGCTSARSPGARSSERGAGGVPWCPDTDPTSARVLELRGDRAAPLDSVCEAGGGSRSLEGNVPAQGLATASVRQQFLFPSLLVVRPPNECFKRGDFQTVLMQ